ncbi:NAD(P)H-dependent flavin oxidoreductase [Prauserella flavalba]|uniref:2-nitropropane dioxygenase n=1 Tax=Prauserella flavalba TaxID=1477506 RepID=A0A318LLY5_9PSEU|nr:nitronate monooxygenase [Prauserella flavalba]PXY35361.1 2-nitropropane dioxygenase [Prauserella flavalba]
MLTTTFTTLTGCRVPIQQAPMGPIAAPELVTAVADAGGVGTVAALGMTPEELGTLSAALRTDGVLAANFASADIDPAAVEFAAERFRIVDFFWHDPDPALVALAHTGGALVLWQVGSVGEARQAVDAGADMVAVQGAEAGGHVRGHTALLPLLESVLDEVDVPVLAAGGIGTARGVAAVLAAGAAGVRVGTRFIATTESGAHPGYVAALLAAGPDSTEISDGFADCPLCATVPRARVLRSAVAAVSALGGDTVGSMTVHGETITLPARAGLPPHRGVRGHVEAMALYAGEAVAAVTEVRDAAEVVRELAEGAERLLSR